MAARGVLRDVVARAANHATPHQKSTPQVFPAPSTRRWKNFQLGDTTYTARSETVSLGQLCRCAKCTPCSVLPNNLSSDLTHRDTHPKSGSVEKKKNDSRKDKTTPRDSRLRKHCAYAQSTVSPTVTQTTLRLCTFTPTITVFSLFLSAHSNTFAKIIKYNLGRHVSASVYRARVIFGELPAPSPYYPGDNLGLA